MKWPLNWGTWLLQYKRRISLNFYSCTLRRCQNLHFQWHLWWEKWQLNAHLSLHVNLLAHNFWQTCNYYSLSPFCLYKGMIMSDIRILDCAPPLRWMRKGRGTRLCQGLQCLFLLFWYLFGIILCLFSSIWLCLLCPRVYHICHFNLFFLVLIFYSLSLGS